MCLRTSREGIERRSVSREIRSGARPEALGAEVWPKDFSTEKHFWLLRARKTASQGREILCATAQRIFLTDPLLRHKTRDKVGFGLVFFGGGNTKRNDCPSVALPARRNFSEVGAQAGAAGGRGGVH